MFLAPLGSKGGTATTVEARATRVAMAMEMVFIMEICRGKGGWFGKDVWKEWVEVTWKNEEHQALKE